MKNKDKLINRIIEGFQHNKGKASCYCFTPEVIPEIVYNIISRIISKRTNATIFIGVDCYNTRSNIMNYLKQKLDMNIVSHIKCLSIDYIKPYYHYKHTINFIIGINDTINIIHRLCEDSKFTFCAFTKNIMDANFINDVRNILPSIDTADLDSAIQLDNIYSPVEEHRYGVDLSDSDKELYDKYTDYINTSISIFGELANIEKCKKGDEKTGVSAVDFRNKLAYNNGWREDLDTVIPFMKQIDEIYNPNVLYERACNFYNIAKQRRDLVCDNDAKLEIIKDICIDNKDKKILIISKRGEFAAKVTKYINAYTDLKCGDYHDCIDDAMAVDDNNVPILIKSGVNKGKVKIVGAQAQSSINERRFNDNIINILSIKTSSNVKLKIACDIVIFTSPFCDNIIEVRKRFRNVVFNNINTKTYRIYCNSTIENAKLNTERENPIITIVDETENNIFSDENLVEIIL